MSAKHEWFHVGHLPKLGRRGRIPQTVETHGEILSEEVRSTGENVSFPEQKEAKSEATAQRQRPFHHELA